MHQDQLPLAPSVASQLVREQFDPSVSDVRLLQTPATTSYVFRVGADFSARFSMLGDDAVALGEGLAQERAAMHEFAAASSFPSPEIVFIGQPAHGYPMPWTIQLWIPGDVMTPDSAASSAAVTEDLVALIRELRGADVRGRSFRGGGRGGDLKAQEEWVAHCLSQSQSLLPVERLRDAWAALRTTPRREPDVMSHQDLIPFNLLAGARLTGILDTGSFGPADPALDLVVGWHALDDERREQFRDGLAPSADEWRRGAAWALAQALGLVWYYATTNPAMSALGRSTIDRILSSADIGV